MKLGVAYFICLIIFFTAMYGVARLVENVEPKRPQKLQQETTETGIKFSDDCKYYIVPSSVGVKYLIRCKNRAEMFMEKELTKEEINEFEKRYSDIMQSRDFHIGD